MLGATPDDIEPAEDSPPAGEPRGGAAVHGARRDHQREQRGLPDLDVTPNCRYVYRPQFQVPDKERKFGNLTLTYATQIHACVIEVDPETGVYEIVQHGAVTTAARASTHGSSTARCTVRRRRRWCSDGETFTYDEEGKPADAQLLYDYHVPHALDMPPLKNGFIESPSPFTPLGAKGMGEGGGAGIHAVCAALQDALRGRRR